MPKTETKKNRCWPGYEPVPGKKPYSQGSCRPKAKSKLATGEKTFRAKRVKQLQHWQEEHPGSPRKAAQHLHAPGTSSGKKSSAKKKSAKTARKRSSKRSMTRVNTPDRPHSA